MSKANELIVFTHNDLDALGCSLNIEFKFPNVQKKYFYTNYANIDQRVEEIESHMKENGNKHIMIADVSFSDNKDALRKLYNLGNCTHIDHHLYPDGFWDEFPNMKVQWDKSRCATLICNEYFGNAGKNDRLDKLTRIIDVYDLWQTEEREFDLAQDFNNYFWTYDISLLTEKIVENDFKLPDDFVEVTTNIRNHKNEQIKKYHEQKMIQRAGKMTICFFSDCFNPVMIDEMRNGQDVLIGVDSYGIIKVRIRQDSPLTPDDKKLMREKLTGTSDIGHMDAFTYKYKGSQSFDNLMNEVQKIITIYNEITG